MSSVWNRVAGCARWIGRAFHRDGLSRVPSAAELWPGLPWGGRLFDRLPVARERVRVVTARGESAYLDLAWRTCSLAPESAPTLVFIPGLGDSSETWRLLVDALAPTAHLVLVDPPGFGRSQVWRTRHAFRAEVLRDALRELIVQRGWNRPSTVLVGNSLGGALAMGIAAALGRRNRIGRLVLLAPAAYPQELTLWIRAQRMPCHAAFAHFMPKRVLASLALWASVGDPRSVARESIVDLERHLSRPWGLRAFQYLSRDLSQICRKARCGQHNILSALVPKFARTRARLRNGTRGAIEVLLLYGDRDLVVPRWVPERLAVELPRVEHRLLPGVGHLPQIERPFEVAEELRRFLVRTAAEAAPSRDLSSTG